MGCISGLTLCQMCPSDGPTGCAYRIIGCAPAYGLMAKCAPRVRGWDYDVKRSSYTLSTTRGSPHVWKLMAQHIAVRRMAQHIAVRISGAFL